MRYKDDLSRCLRVIGFILGILYCGAVGLTGAVDLAHPAAAQTGTAVPPSEPGPEGGTVPGQTLGSASDAEIWRQIRRGAAGTVTIPQDEAGVLIQSEGEQWRSIRNGPLSTYGSWLLFGAVGVAALYFAIRGRIRIAAGRSGQRMTRFSLTQRVTHWFTGVLFLLLGTTGLILLYGKYVLIPLVGAPAFGAIASAAMQAHNLFGPLFILAILTLFVVFVRGNGFRLIGLGWFLRLGGFFGGHIRTGRYNAGEKSWFWAAVLLGLVLSASGLALEFPYLLGERQDLQLANLVHGIAALLFICGGLAHIYLGTIGMEGALEAMTRGDVDTNWAKEHHDVWHDEMVAPDAAESPKEARP
ncbi:MAG: formate dehydrogenase subunit gamma [Inquilinus sp.]|nr:formate dehydrogenase subunit gamma [Inquilinus sp.]